MIYICTWHRAATFCRHDEILTSLFIFCKVREKTSRSYLCGEFWFSESPVQIQNWTIIYHGTEHFVSAPLFFTWDYTLSFLQQRLCTASETHIFHKVMCRTFAQHIYTAEILNIPPRASKWKFSPVTELKYLNICVLRFVSGNVCQQLSVTTKRCSCFRGDKSWENAGLLLGSLSQHEDIMLATWGSTSLGMSSRLFWNPTAPTTCMGFNPLHGTRMVASSHRITPKL